MGDVASGGIVEYADSNQFIAPTAPGYGTAPNINWNAMSGFAFNNGNIHCFYSGGNPTAHAPYARFNMSTKAVDVRVKPKFTAGGVTQNTNGDSGVFVQDTSLASRLYFVGCTATRIIVFRSDDGGANWSLYAQSSPVPAGFIIYAGAFRYVLSDGSIVGSFLNNAISPATCGTCRVTPL